MHNLDVRRAAKAAGVPLWQIAEKLEFSEPTMTRKMRHELPKSEKSRIFKAIEQIETERKGGIAT